MGTAGAASPVLFATLDQGRAALIARDDLVMRLSPFDRAARLKTDRDVSEREYLEFVGNSVLPWENDTKKERVARAVGFVQKRFRDLSIRFPDEILVVRTTGREEGGASYTRGNVIVLPDNILVNQDQDLAQLIGHEIFHNLSRNDESLRTNLYKTIGFEPCLEFLFPAVLAPRKITNPDAPKNDHRIKVKYRGQPAWAVPVLYAAVDKYDRKKGGEFFDYLEFRLALTSVADIPNNANASFVQVEEVEGFFEQVGRNTDYIIHPEEILADNFALLIVGQRSCLRRQFLQRYYGY